MKTLKAHLIFAHPHKDSFNGILFHTIKSELRKNKISLTETHVFNGENNSFPGISDTNNIPLHLQNNLLKSQEYAYKNDLFCDFISNEQSNLQACDLLILQFPIWWWGPPSTLKSWIERVCSFGFAYGSGFHLKDKKVLLSVTTGSNGGVEENVGTSNRIMDLAESIFGYMKCNVLEPYVTHGPYQMNANEKLVIINNLKRYIFKLIME